MDIRNRTIRNTRREKMYNKMKENEVDEEDNRKSEKERAGEVEQK